MKLAAAMTCIIFVGCSATVIPEESVNTLGATTTDQMVQSNHKFAGYWDAIEDGWEKFDFYEGFAFFQTSVADMPRSKVLLLAAHWADSEICNGGFDQLFYNSTGLIVPEAIEGFILIGATEEARLLQRAAHACFPAEYPRDRDERVAQYDSRSDDELAPLDELQDRYFEINDSNPWYAKADQYVQTHPGEFIQLR